MDITGRGMAGNAGTLYPCFSVLFYFSSKREGAKDVEEIEEKEEKEVIVVYFNQIEEHAIIYFSLSSFMVEHKT